MTRVLADRYELVERLGRGAMGEVWRARDTRLQRDVAIKIVDPAGHPDPSVQARFEREAIATAGLSSPYVVGVYDAGTDGDTSYLVMELLSGRNLADELRERGRLPWAEAVTVGAQVATGLAAAHRIGVTHRDVKPANVMLHEGRAKVVDFGIARLTQEQGSELTATATVIGTASYMSPEQASGRVAGTASDVYSLGCLLYALVAGRPPFAADNPVAVARAHVTDPVPSLRGLVDVPAAVEAVIEACLVKDPAARPNADDVAAALRAIEADPTVAPSLLPTQATAALPVATGALPAGASAAVTSAPSRRGDGVPVHIAPAPPPLTPVAPAVPAAAEPRRRRAGLWFGLAAACLAALVVLGGFGWPGWWRPAAEPGPVASTTSAPVASEMTTSEPTPTPSSNPPVPVEVVTPSAAPTSTLPKATTQVSAPAAPRTTTSIKAEVKGVDDAISGVKGKAKQALSKQWKATSSNLQPGQGSSQLDPMYAAVAGAMADGSLTAADAARITAALDALGAKL